VAEQRLVDDPGANRDPAEVDDPVADRVGGDEVVNRDGGLPLDECELQAGRAGVDDEDVQYGQTQSRISGSSSPCSRV
jgi:hypothetical protein